MNGADYVGVILAAGKGSRMAPFDNYPKPILPIANRPLIQYHLETMRSLGISDIIVLVGHKGFEISKVLGDGSSFGVNIRYVEQARILGIAHAVGCLEPYISRPFLLVLGDVHFIHRDLGEMFDQFKQQQSGAVLATKEEPDPEAIRRNFSVTLSSDGLVTRVVEKPRYTTSRLKGVGLYLFDVTIFDAIRRTPRTAMRDEYEITESIQVMIDDGHPVHATPCVDDDINLTFPADLLRCNLDCARGSSSGVIIGENASIHPDAQITESIIGSNVTIRHPIRIQRSLVFEGSTVDLRTDLEHFVVTPTHMVDCKSGMQIGQANG